MYNRDSAIALSLVSNGTVFRECTNFIFLNSALFLCFWGTAKSLSFP